MGESVLHLKQAADGSWFVQEWRSGLPWLAVPLAAWLSEVGLSPAGVAVDGAAARVSAFCTEWRTLRGRDPEVVYALHGGGHVEGGLDLLAADLEALVAGLTAQPVINEAALRARGESLIRMFSEGSDNQEYLRGQLELLGALTSDDVEGYVNAWLKGGAL